MWSRLSANCSIRGSIFFSASMGISAYCYSDRYVIAAKDRSYSKDIWRNTELQTKKIISYVHDALQPHFDENKNALGVDMQFNDMYNYAVINLGGSDHRAFSDTFQFQTKYDTSPFREQSANSGVSVLFPEIANNGRLGMSMYHLIRYHL